MIPFASPVSFRAAFSPQPFTPDYELNEKDVCDRPIVDEHCSSLYSAQTSSKSPFQNTDVSVSSKGSLGSRQTLATKVRTNTWSWYVRWAPDALPVLTITPHLGFLGKNMQRLFNQFWNYIAKGFIGTVVICVVYPASCLLLSTVSFIVGVLSPIWYDRWQRTTTLPSSSIVKFRMPIASLILHILQILFYDANSAGRIDWPTHHASSSFHFVDTGEYGRKFFCLINIILTDFFLCGLIQPILVLIALIVSPIISLLIVICKWTEWREWLVRHRLCLDALLHRCTCGLYDKIIFHLVVKRFARIPAHNGFLARRTAGPGLAAEYFYQVSSPEVLAALESLIEQNELEVYRSYVERLLMSPIDEYRSASLNQRISPRHEHSSWSLDVFSRKRSNPSRPALISNPAIRCSAEWMTWSKDISKTWRRSLTSNVLPTPSFYYDSSVLQGVMIYCECNTVLSTIVFDWQNLT